MDGHQPNSWPPVRSAHHVILRSPRRRIWGAVPLHVGAATFTGWRGPPTSPDPSSRCRIGTQGDNTPWWQLNGLMTMNRDDSCPSSP